MRVSIIGVASLYKSNAGGKKNSSSVKQLYINVVGMMFESSGAGGIGDGLSFTPKEEEAFIGLSRRRDIYQILTNR